MHCTRSSLEAPQAYFLTRSTICWHHSLCQLTYTMWLVVGFAAHDAHSPPQPFLQIVIPRISLYDCLCQAIFRLGMGLVPLCEQ